MNCYWASQRDHPTRKSRGHNQEQAFSRGRSDVFEISQFIPNCGQPPLLDVVCVPTQHSKHFWFQRASHSHHTQTFCHHFFLSFKRRKPIPSYLYFALVLYLAVLCRQVVFVVADKLPRSRTTWVARNTEKDSDEDAQFKYRRLKSLRRLDCVTNETGLLNCFA